jgi:serine protease AprX
MAVTSIDLVELVLLGPTNDHRQLQDSPILGDVWIKFAENPAVPRDLLITPYKDCPAGPVAVTISKKIKELDMHHATGDEANVAYLQGLVAARLFFTEVIQIVVPMTQWWQDRKVQEGLQHYTPERLQPIIQTIINWAQAKKEARPKLTEAFAKFSALDRYVALAGVILWAGLLGRNKMTDTTESPVDIGVLLENVQGTDAIVNELQQAFTAILADARKEEKIKKEKETQVWQISLNRKAMPALEKSAPAVKADAAWTLFKVKCDEIVWAVLDSGIDGAHPALQDEQGKSRVVKTFDFSNIRQIVSLDNQGLDIAGFKERYGALLENLKNPPKEEEALKILDELAKDAENDRPIHWQVVEQLIEIDPAKQEPPSGHGTHVAGIIGARAVEKKGYAAGMCPDIKLYDLRVLAKSLEDTEFAIIAALQYIRYLNERNNFFVIHGANLSLSIPHDVRNFACGRTPICNECERLVGNGVVVVAAAGNFGYQRYETKEGQYEGYTAFSITDPGNADGVITVGATHRFWPHTYGVSFFSSRGPTGDGRMKPDLVAPGERIQSCLPKEDWGELDGTSMAAPHVSGAAAMLMARYSELISQPRTIKRILCESATDLERERSFQGHGMLDVLRAFQHI